MAEEMSHQEQGRNKDKNPFETTAILVKKQDTRGGSGANFIVKWSSKEPIYEPISEAVMVGHSRNQSISFKSIGRPLVQRLE